MERMQVAAITQINELWKTYTEAVSAGDMERWLSLWIEDGIQMPPSVPRRIGKGQIRAEMQTFFDQFDGQITVHLEEVRVVGDLAYSHGTYDFVMTPKSGGELIQISGKFLTILHRQMDGSWKIAVDCFNYDALYN